LLPRDSSPQLRYNLTLRLCANVLTSTSRSPTKRLTHRVKVSSIRKMTLNCKCRSTFRLLITMMHEVNKPIQANQISNRFPSEIKSETNSPPSTLALTQNDCPSKIQPQFAQQHFSKTNSHYLLIEILVASTLHSAVFSVYSRLIIKPMDGL